MKYILLISGFLMSIVMIATIGLYALNLNQQISISFEEGEKHFRAITTAASEVSSYVKRAEGHLFLYLILDRKTDKEKFPKRIASLHQQISILDMKVENPEARKILSKIKQLAIGLLSTGNTLIAYHDKAMEDIGDFEVEAHREAIFNLHENFSAIRKFGVELTAFEIKLENDIRLDVLKNARRMRIYMVILITLALSFATCLGYILSRMIKKLNKEIYHRTQSEKVIHSERDKLKDALANVKILSGLLPICASCKKIRDDSGYWNQIETYIRDHSGAEFSHSICPECAKKYYPDLFEEEAEE